MKQRFSLFLFSALLLLLTSRTEAQKIFVPNASFELPTISFVSVNVDCWQKTPKPDWYEESGTFLWEYNIGGFKNTAPTSTNNHIVNCHSNQAIWLFAVKDVTLYQDYESMDYNDPAPTHAFDAKFEPGKSYHLTVGVIGTGGGMHPDATLDLTLYYRDDQSNRVSVVTTTMTNTPTIFSNATYLVDCWVHVPVVQPGDAWAGKHIGIQFMSTVSTNIQGGYWDLDNVRLSAGPALQDPILTNGQLQFTLLGQPGSAFEIVGSPDLDTPISNWTSVGFITNESNTTTFSAPAPASDRIFYRARQLP